MRNESYFPRAIKHTVREFLDDLKEDRPSFRLSLFRAIYWFCALHNNGQNSRLYQISGTIPYLPGPFEQEPNSEDLSENYLDWEVFQALNDYMGV